MLLYLPFNHAHLLFAQHPEITENCITFQRGRFRHRARARFQALNRLKVTHTNRSNNTQRNTHKQRRDDIAGRAGARCATPPTPPPTPLGCGPGIPRSGMPGPHFSFAVPKREPCPGSVWITESTLRAFQNRFDRVKRCPGCKVMILLVPSTC